eukprot:GHVN01053843.1.p1 GENE.GHVN01053843.1~~GHVN01053843.1.p1  ORF type:complete len:159 (+),score=5.06 GHVN01053843.1:41-517(+)
MPEPVEVTSGGESQGVVGGTPDPLLGRKTLVMGRSRNVELGRNPVGYGCPEQGETVLATKLLKAPKRFPSIRLSFVSTASTTFSSSGEVVLYRESHGSRLRSIMVYSKQYSKQVHRRCIGIEYVYVYHTAVGLGRRWFKIVGEHHKYLQPPSVGGSYR